MSFTSNTDQIDPHHIRIVLFDLDNTLVNTDELEVFRNTNHPFFNQDKEYIKEIQSFLVNTKPYIPLTTLEEIKKHNIKLGLLTNSPRKYAYAVISALYKGIKTFYPFDVVVAFENVERHKPFNDGIFRAINELKKNDESLFDIKGTEVLYIGDNNTDILTAYNGGCLAALLLSEQEQLHYKNSNTLPEFIITPTNLVDIVTYPDKFLPFMESNYRDISNYEKARFLYFNKTDFEGKTRYATIVAGRYFPQTDFFKYKIEFHSLTHEILALKEGDDFPVKWVETLRQLLISETIYSIFGHLEVVLSCIPHRIGRPHRLENLLKQLAKYLDDTPIERDCTFYIIPDLFFYDDEALSNHKEAKTRENRFKNVREHLHLKRRKDIPNSVDKVILIDDVITTGASLIEASKKLEKEGIENIVRFAFAQAISEGEF